MPRLARKNSVGQLSKPSPELKIHRNREEIVECFGDLVQLLSVTLQVWELKDQALGLKIGTNQGQFVGGFLEAKRRRINEFPPCPDQVLYQANVYGCGVEERCFHLQMATRNSWCHSTLERGQAILHMPRLKMSLGIFV